MNKEVQELEEKLSTLEDNPFGVRFDPIETLQECLYHSSDDIRERAARLAGSFPSEQFIEPLFRMAAENHDLNVRLAAIQALGAFLHHGRMVDYHRRESREDPLSGEAVMSELSPVQFEAIRDFMGEVATQADWPSTLRAEALQHYAPLEPDQAASLIHQFYQSGEPVLIEGALKAIARLESGDWKKLITQEVHRNRYDRRRLAAVEAAGTHDVSEVGPELAGLLEQTEHEEFRRAAAEALSLISWNRAPEELEQYVEDRDEAVREFAQIGVQRGALERERRDSEIH